MRDRTPVGARAKDSATLLEGVAPPTLIDSGKVGLFSVPGADRTIWWTGRVAIGLGHRAHCRINSSAQPSDQL